MKHYLQSADILLPAKNFETWSVIACDQYTSENEYWNEVENTVNENPSTLKITLPEIYLEDNCEKRIEKINENMLSYLGDGTVCSHNDSMVYVERTQKDGRVRRGLVGLIDLAEYDYKVGSKTLIRATEKTVLERIPPRVKIRENAALEIPHIMLLIDDPNFTVIEPFKSKKDELKTAYNFELMLGGGHIEGKFLTTQDFDVVNSALDKLIENSDDKFLFAVGDGNHSLATAKECYNKNKNDLSRYALVEVVNIHDQAIEFEPIYRVLFNCDPKKVLADFERDLKLSENSANCHNFKTICNSSTQNITVSATSKLPVGTLQKWLDDYLEQNKDIKIDYIHGEDSVEMLCRQENTLGFIFDGMGKDELFPAIKQDGSLPRKTFSMGHAYDKRYYIECRKIKD